MAKAVAFTQESAARIGRAVRKVEGQGADVSGRRLSHPFVYEIWAKITDKAVMTANRYKYAWTQQRETEEGWEDMPDGLTGTTSTNFALNSCEANNPATAGEMGNSVDTDDTDTDLAPVRHNPVVRMYVGRRWNDSLGVWAPTFRFQYENTVDCGE